MELALKLARDLDDHEMMARLRSLQAGPAPETPDERQSVIKEFSSINQALSARVKADYGQPKPIHRRL
ncbi:hypothetical protein ACFSC4_08170 [Deinococcus malanensis]